MNTSNLRIKAINTVTISKKKVKMITEFNLFVDTSITVVKTTVIDNRGKELFSGTVQQCLEYINSI